MEVMSTTSGNENIDEMIKRLMQEQVRHSMRRAYLFVEPDVLSSIQPIEFPESEQIRFRPYIDYSVKMLGMPMLVSSHFMDCGFGPSSATIAKPVVWKDVPKPAIVPAWQWCVVVACLSVLLVSMANCFG